MLGREIVCLHTANDKMRSFIDCVRVRVKEVV